MTPTEVTARPACPVGGGGARAVPSFKRSSTLQLARGLCVAVIQRAPRHVAANSKRVLWQTTLEHLKRCVREQGPFDGLLGYSMGA